jgi:hypothetical protein
VNIAYTDKQWSPQRGAQRCVQTVRTTSVSGSHTMSIQVAHHWVCRRAVFTNASLFTNRGERSYVGPSLDRPSPRHRASGCEPRLGVPHVACCTQRTQRGRQLVRVQTSEFDANVTRFRIAARAGCRGRAAKTALYLAADCMLSLQMDRLPSTTSAHTEYLVS